MIAGVLAAMAQGCGQAAPSSNWWVDFEVVPERNWGSRGKVRSILGLLDSGAFTPERVAQIRAAVQS